MEYWRELLIVLVGFLVVVVLVYGWHWAIESWLDRWVEILGQTGGKE